MKKVNIAFVIALLVAGVGTTATFAQTAPDAPKGERAQKMQERLKAADKDGDGKISREESVALPRLAKHFDEIDANKDGFVTKVEMKAHREKQAANRPK